MAESNEEKPRIIADDDWKAEAQKQKEDADRQAQEEASSQQIPAPQFAEILQMIVVQAAIGLGGVQDPQTGQPMPVNLPVASHYIELLELLKSKTANNLEEQEQSMIDGMLQELRMAYVQVANQAGGQAQPPTA
jgi:hypothetical protein